MIYIIFQVKTIATNNTHVPNHNCFLFIPLIYFYYKIIILLLLLNAPIKKIKDGQIRKKKKNVATSPLFR